MREVELKSVVTDTDALIAKLRASGVSLDLQGRLEDRRYDTQTRSLIERDEMLRIRTFTGIPKSETTLDWKGATRVVDGYKVREELSTLAGDAGQLDEILSRLGFRCSMVIDREITQFSLAGATIRFERYPRMDDLVEVEGTPETIEAAIALLELPRRGFTSERLTAFVSRFEARTGVRAELAAAEVRTLR